MIFKQKQKVPEWEEFEVNFGNREGLNSVSHVGHLDIVERIISDNQIKSRLVYDESKLNTSRITVVWLSPNDWTGAGGFRYGNIRFTFNWQEIIENKNYYWVETIRYGIPACRILITDVDRSNILPSYDPYRDNGPWQIDPLTGEHIWNSMCCLEIMLEENLRLEDCQKVDFVDHHSRLCSELPNDCGTKGLSRYIAGGRFIANIVGNNLSINSLHLTITENGLIKPCMDLRLAYFNLHNQLYKLSPSSWGHVTRRHMVADPLIKSILSDLSKNPDNDDILRLASLFNSKDDLMNCTKKVIGQSFGLTDPDDLIRLD